MELTTNTDSSKLLSHKHTIVG